MFVPSEPLQTDEDLQQMFNLLKAIAWKYNKLDFLLRSRTLDNRSPLAVAMCHPNCTESIIKELIIKPMDASQLLLAFDLATQKHLFKPDLLKLLLDNFGRYSTIEKNIFIQIACRYNHIEILRWLVVDQHLSTFIFSKNSIL
jgi:hypothetical protein